MQAVQVVVPKAGDIKLKCNTDWDDCQKKQACAKVKHMDTLAKNTPGGLGRVTKLAPASYPRLRAQGDYAAAKQLENPTVNDFADDCMKDPPNNKKRMSPDHFHEIQYGGHPDGPLRWMDSSVNSSMGTKLGKTSPDVTHATGFSMDCC
jgi:hypothetical protein